MSTVDEILASGRYTDRRGRHWDHYRSADTWTHFPSGRRLTRAQMRLLIERDQHRNECPGLSSCLDHPVISVDRSGPRAWHVWGPGDWYRGRFNTLPEAMGAAHALAVEP